MNIEQLQPDAYTRFRAVCIMIEKLLKGWPTETTVRLLDIGGSSEYITEFLKSSKYTFSLTVIDPLPRPDNLPKSVRYIQNGGETASTLGEQFDIVIMIDMLEHLPGEKLKSSIVNEAIKVSKLGVVIAGPFNSPDTDAYEHKLNTINKTFFGQDQHWLKEHFEYGKPSMDSVLNIFKKNKWQTTNFATLPYKFWYASSIANLIPGISKFVDAAKLHKLNESFNKKFNNSFASHITDAGYREFVLAVPEGSKIDISRPPKKADEAYSEYEDLYNEISVDTVMNSQSNFTKVEAQLQENSAKIGELNADIDSYKSKIDTLSDENQQNKADLEAQLAWRNEVENNIAYKVARKSLSIKRKMQK